MKESFEEKPEWRRKIDRALYEREVREGMEIVSVETENARYELVQSQHDVPNSLEQLGNPDAVVLETGTTRFRKNPKEIIELLETHPQSQYSVILQEVKKRQVPIYFVDVPFKDEGERLVNEYIFESSPFYDIFKPEPDPGRHAGEQLVATAIVFPYLLKQVFELKKAREENRPITRRQFLTSSGAIAAALYLGTGLSNPLFDALDRFFNPKVKLRERLDEEYKNEQIMAELLLAFRNAVMAEKMEHIARRIKTGEQGDKPQITAFLGALHISDDENSLNRLLALEGDLAKNRTEVIRKFLEKPSFAEHVVDPREITRIVSLKFNSSKDEWELETQYDDYMLGGGRG